MANNTKYITLENLKKYDELLKTYIAAHASSGSSSAFRVEKVDTLPNANDAEAGVLYVVTNGTNAEGQRFDEYMLIDNAMELVGSSSIDLSGYYTKTEVEEAIAAYAPFEVVEELPARDAAKPSKIYIVTVGTESLQKGSYVYTGTGPYADGYVSVGTTVQPADRSDVEGTQNNGGNDPDPNDPNQGGNGGNSGNDPDPNQGGNEGGNTDPTPLTPIECTFTLAPSDVDIIDQGNFSNDDLAAFMAQLDLGDYDNLAEYMEEEEDAAKVHLYYIGYNGNLTQTVELPYSGIGTIDKATLTAIDADSWQDDGISVKWFAKGDANKIGIKGVNTNNSPMFKIVYDRS